MSATPALNVLIFMLWPIFSVNPSPKFGRFCNGRGSGDRENSGGASQFRDPNSHFLNLQCAPGRKRLTSEGLAARIAVSASNFPEVRDKSPAGLLEVHRRIFRGGRATG